MTVLSRRRFLQTGLAAAASVTFGPGFWRDALAVPPIQVGSGPYGPLLPADANGIMLPAGFTSRVIAQGGQVVAGTGYPFPVAPDGQATFPLPGGGWILVTNTEVSLIGGVSAIRFDNAGNITAAYRILNNTSVNCAGGPTPWGTWLSCEEIGRGQVWECDPTGATPAVARPLMGLFQHEAAAVDPVHQHVYLTEDTTGGGLYRFVPSAYPDLAAGVLEIACGDGCSPVVWKPVPDPGFTGGKPLREQVRDSLKFARGEGIWYDAGLIYVVTTTDETIHVYDTNTSILSVLYRAADAVGTPLSGIDNLHVSRSGDLFVAEDSYSGDPDAMDVCILTPGRRLSRFLKLTGAGHFMPGGQSETTGITFDPSGTRMYVASQRYQTSGIVYEITGPFRQDHPVIAAPAFEACPPPPPAPPAADHRLGPRHERRRAGPADRHRPRKAHLDRLADPQRACARHHARRRSDRQGAHHRARDHERAAPNRDARHGHAQPQARPHHAAHQAVEVADQVPAGAPAGAHRDR